MQGNRIGKDEVREAFRELALEEDQLALVYDYLEKHHIEVNEKLGERSADNFRYFPEERGKLCFYPPWLAKCRPRGS